MKKRTLPILAILLIALFFISSNVYAQTNIFLWDFDDEAKRALVTASDDISDYEPDEGAGTIDLIGGPIFTVWVLGVTGDAPNTSGWDDGDGTKYWSVVTSTVGFENLLLSSAQRGSNTGPRDFTVEYSVDGTTWVDVPGSDITVTNDFTSGLLTNVPLPAACENQPTLYLRWIMTSNTSVNGGTVGSTGTNRIDDILLTGEEPITLTVDIEGEGSVDVSFQDSFILQTKGSITECDEFPCKIEVNFGDIFELFADPEEGWEFIGWTGHFDETVDEVFFKGSSSTSNPIEIVISGDTSITAIFASDDEAVAVPLTNWALYFGIALMVVFAAIRFRGSILQ